MANFNFAKRSACAAALLTLGIGGLHAQSTELTKRLRLDSGSVQGMPRSGDGVLAFKGIPYAAPPIGRLRWSAPQPVSRWDGIVDATHYGHRCLSALEIERDVGPARSEDCLTLNIWTGALTTDEKRPVMVWVHGGGFQFGSSANPTTDGTALADKGVLVVTFNYRLGVLGYLAHPDLDKEGPSGDYGLQDQVAALHWVQDNIARFGGDPTNITIFGESAGAHAIGILMASPLSKGLFQKAIGESGALWDGTNGAMEDFDEAHARGVRFVQRVGARSIADLRAMPAEKLNAAAPWNFTMDPIVTAFSPNVDRYVVPETPAARYHRGEQMHIPLLAGWNDVEQFPFRAFALPHRTAGEFRDAASRMFGKDRIPEFLSLYPASTDAEASTSADALTGDLVIAEQTWSWLDAQRRTGHAPVYGYKFAYTSPYTPVASHITEIPFVFGTLTPQMVIGSKMPAAEADRALSDTMSSYWVNFARRGDPNGPGLPSWPAFNDAGIVQRLATSVGPMPNPQEARFRFIASFRKAGVFPMRWRPAS